MLVAMVENEERYFTYQFISGLDDELIAEMRQKFERYHKVRTILNASFEDNTWKMSDEKQQYMLDFRKLETSYQFVVRHHLMIDAEQMVLACKVYVMIQLGTQAMSTISSMLWALYQLLEEFITQDVETALQNLKLSTLRQLVNFFSLLEGASETIAYIQEVLEALPPLSDEKKRRSLAPFLSYFRFCDVMKVFWEHAGEELKVRYFPLWLWWHLTTILPLRPTEFTLTPRDCLSYTEDGQVKLNVRRTKMKKQRGLYTYRIAFDYELCTYTIPQGLAEEIKTYIEQTECLPEQRNHVLFRTKKGTDFNYDQLAGLLRDFYEEIVPQYYSVVQHGGHLEEKEICRIFLGDTRHIAMISLILQGGNPVVCKELAGHEDINISSHYYGNLSELVDCMTYELYRKRSRKPSRSTQILPLRPRFEKYVEVEGGRCYSTRYAESGSVEDCLAHWDEQGMLGDCQTCKYFRANNRAFRLEQLQKRQAEAIDLSFECLNMVIKQVRLHQLNDEELNRAMAKLNHTVQAYTETKEEILTWQDQQNIQRNS